MAKIKVFGLFLEKKSSDFVDFQYWSPFLLCLTTGPRKIANLNVFCLISRIDTVNTCKNPFLGHFLEFELHVFAHIAQDDTFYCYLVPSSDKTAEKIFLVKILRINDIAHNERTK